MRIREEIEKLKIHMLYLGNKIPPEEVDLIRRDDVLSLLDEWELVAEETIPHSYEILTWIDGLRNLPISPGDTIAIYVERKDASQA